MSDCKHEWEEGSLHDPAKGDAHLEDGDLCVKCNTFRPLKAPQCSCKEKVDRLTKALRKLTNEATYAYHASLENGVEFGELGVAIVDVKLALSRVETPSEAEPKKKKVEPTRSILAQWKMEARMWKQIAREWERSYDKLKAMYEPEELICSAQTPSSAPAEMEIGELLGKAPADMSLEEVLALQLMCGELFDEIERLQKSPLPSCEVMLERANAAYVELWKALDTIATIGTGTGGCAGVTTSKLREIAKAALKKCQ